MSVYEEQDYSKEFNAGIWIKLLRLTAMYKKEIIIMVVFMILNAACDAVFPLFTKLAIDEFITKNSYRHFTLLGAGYLGLVLFQAFTIYYFIRNSGRLECGMVYTIRQIGFQRLQELSFSYYDNTPVGWILSRMTSDAQRIGDVIAWSSIDLIWGVAIILIASVNMFVLDIRLALITLSTFPVLMAVSVLFQRLILRSHREVRKINSKITGSYNEGINGARTTKTLIREEKNFEEFEALSGGMRGVSIRAAVYSSIYLPIVISLGSIGVGLVLWIGGGRVQSNLLSFGTYSVFIAYAIQIFEPVQQIARVFSEFQSAQASAERTLSLIETQPDIVDRPEIEAVYGDSIHPKTENWPPIRGEIEFEHTDFTYKTCEKVLTDFTLHVKAGEKIALVGETGAGKSTIVNLLCRLYEPTGGQIRIDGTDYRERSQIWLQSNLGYVLQTPHLFSGTIADNIRYAKLDATDEEIINAAQTVNAYDFIMKLENGFETQAGEGGSRLSSGQKQLISFARAIIADPKIFVLDEATSSVDTETEKVIQEAVDKALRGRTVFIVAHRLSTIRSCDRILVIHNGRISEQGSHKELLNLKGAYYHLYTNQFREEAENKILQA